MRNQSKVFQRRKQTIQYLVEKELQIECQIHSLQNKIDLFETQYLINTRNTGNVYMGWPLTYFRENNENLLKSKQKKTLNPIFIIDQHEKLFSLSSTTSKASQRLTESQYLTTRQVDRKSQSKIMIKQFLKYQRGKRKYKKSNTIQPISRCNFNIKLKNNLINEQIKDENQLINSNSNDEKVNSQNHDNLDDQKHITNQNIHQIIDQEYIYQDQNQQIQPINVQKDENQQSLPINAISFALGNIKIQMFRTNQSKTDKV